jgi:hypothetical protein
VASLSLAVILILPRCEDVDGLRCLRCQSERVGPDAAKHRHPLCYTLRQRD